VLERRTLPEGPTALISTALEDAGFLAAFTERTGGSSEGPYRSLNLGLATTDRPERVFDNRRRVTTGFGLQQVAALRQVHGSTVVNVEAGNSWRGFDGGRREVPVGDALATAALELGLLILTADCVPVVLADPSTGTLVVAHAGWRGVAAGVLEQAVASFPQPGEIRAAVGPAIGPDHYEVGEEVVAAVAAATSGGAVTAGGTTRPHLDLPGTVARILGELGVRRIERSEECTACLPDRFFSYRRDGPTGRQALIAARMS
jgi:YfiH family protein